MLSHLVRTSLRTSRSLRSALVQSHLVHSKIVPDSSPDFMISALNGAMDLSVRVTSCKDMLQERVTKQNLSDDSAKLLGDALVTMSMMCCGLKGEEGRQLSLVGHSTDAISHVIVSGNANHELRGKVSKVDYHIPSEIMKQIPPGSSLTSSKLPLSLFFGPEIGQVQVQKTHPSWKEPSLGVTELDPTLSFATNMALYMTHSEQRQSAIHTEVEVKDGKVINALGLWIERLPCADENNIDKVIENFSKVQQKSMKSFVEETTQARLSSPVSSEDSETPSVLEESLHKIVDSCLEEMVTDGIRWARSCSYKCNCSMQKVWNVLEILPKREIVDIIKKGEGVEMFCDFCGTQYCLSSAEISDHDFIGQK